MIVCLGSNTGVSETHIYPWILIVFLKKLTQNAWSNFDGISSSCGI